MIIKKINFSKKKAQKRLAQIEMFKAMKKSGKYKNLK